MMRKIFILTLTGLLAFYPSGDLVTSPNEKVCIAVPFTSDFELISAWADLINLEEKNYCNDPEANTEWEVLVLKYPADLQIHALHALRMGLCFKVSRGDIDLDQATEIFENMRLALIKSKEWKMEEQLEDSSRNLKRNL
ncbi:MAG: hypothetical protein ACUZ8N_08100 [Candidatus Scalindua sp.]